MKKLFLLFFEYINNLLETLANKDDINQLAPIVYELIESLTDTVNLSKIFF